MMEFYEVADYIRPGAIDLGFGSITVDRDL
jgi:hypothetical protein